MHWCFGDSYIDISLQIECTSICINLYVWLHLCVCATHTHTHTKTTAAFHLRQVSKYSALYLDKRKRFFLMVEANLYILH